MASEIRVNSLTNRSGLSTVSITDAGLNAVGIITAHNFKTGTTDVHSTGVTAADGVFTGNVSVTGNLNVSGVLTYDDVTNIDSVGIITARAGVKVPDNQKIFLGTGDDLQIYHDGSNSIIKDNGTGKLILDTDGTAIEFQKQGLETIASFNSDGAVELYHNNVKKLETTTTGANVTGDFIFGANSKAKLFENGTQSGVQATNSGSSSHLMTHDGNEDIHVDPSGYIKFEVGGSERLRIGSGGGHKITCAEGYYAANLTECNDGRIALNINQTRSGQTKAIAIGAISGNSATGIQCYDTSNNSANNLLLNPFGGNVGVGIDNPGEHLHISGAVRRDTPGSSNIKFLEFSFELPSGTTTTIATVTGPVVSSMAIAKFEYVGLYDYADVGFYSGVEMASLRRSSSNSAYTYLQNSEIHAGGNNSSYQPNMFWQNGSNNTSDLMITTGNYVLIMGTIRITTYNLGLSRVISI